MTPKDVEDKIKIPFDEPITRARVKLIQDATHALLARLGAIVDEPLNPPFSERGHLT